MLHYITIYPACWKLALWCGANCIRSRWTFYSDPCVSKRWRCGAVQIFYVADEASSGILPVEVLALWCGANLLRPRWTLHRDPACRSAGAVVRCKFFTSPMNPVVCPTWRNHWPHLGKSEGWPHLGKKSRQDERKLRLQHVAASGGRLKHRLPYTHADENIPDPCSPLCRSFRDCVLGRRCYVRKQLYVVATLSTENFV